MSEPSPATDRPRARLTRAAHRYTRSQALAPFAYLQAEKAPLYRAILGVFADAKAHFSLHLRPRDVLAGLRSMPAPSEDDDPPPFDPAAVGLGEVESALAQLCHWNNLDRHPDTAEVATVEDFYRARHLYQLTAAGEAAERAVGLFHDTLEQQGELQSAALDDIRVLLGELAGQLDADALDAGKAHRTLLTLSTRFDELTRRAQSFMAGLQRAIDLQGIDVEDFLAYKENLIDYLERFIGELLVATADIASRLSAIEEQGVDRLLDAVAHRDLADALDPSDAERADAEREWRARWRGLRSWFLGDGGTSQAEVLRARARSAIPALLNAVASIHDRRATRSDRTQDLLALARWFAEADSDADAHRLWRAAFGLTPARHLAIDADTLDLYGAEPVSARTSWLDAPPLRVTPRLRRTGRHRRRGRVAKVVDRSREKAFLAEAAEREAGLLAAARRRLATGRTLRLSELGELDRDAFALLLDLLGEVLARGAASAAARGRVEATSSDGSLAIRLEPVDDGGTAVVDTPDGRFCGRDCWIRVRDVFAEPTATAREAAT